ncbi:CAP domain-containing protein [Aeoliella sp. ICT_H6.2]|uniref:CAP domain-containing protein n=1 Tax=Aeoliella straminimaris TaxID=2954799 RepID=A0A9X2JL47_9BACT|nr:CAP domain-containing protein [Aeoliella straminimaris]MCO6048104.1 CAP domain-containing protein [Aeoliella straminimaris]
MRAHFVCLLLAGFLAVDSQPTLAADSQGATESRVTPSQRRVARKLVAHFRRARRDADAQAQVLAQAMQTSPLAVEDICGLIEAQMTPAVTKYREDFFRAASGAAERKFAEADKAEIMRLQQEVNALRQDPNLSKDQIKKVGDPAMKRLAAIALVNRAEVLDTNRKLVERRQQLVPAGKLWEVAQGYLAKVPSKGADDDDKGGALTFDEYLVQEEEIAVRLALPMAAEHRAILAANERLASKLDPEEAKCVLSLNLTRVLLGLDPLLVDLKLTAAARDHSHDMKEHDFFSHESPLPGKKSFVDRAANFGAKASGENIAAGYATGPDVNLGWFHSPGHHKNMLGGHKTVGVGRYGKHWTELFGRG